MKIFRSTEHRRILIEILEARKSAGEKISFSSLAERIGVQKTYVSRVMGGEACWSSDQAFLITEELRFGDEEAEYFHLLVEFERAGPEKRKAALKEKIKEIRRKHLRSQASIEATPITAKDSAHSEYLGDPYHSLVHVYLSLPKFRKNSLRLSDFLGISKMHLLSIFDRLEKLGLITYEPAIDQVTIKQSSVHTPSGSSLVQTHQLMFRTLALDRIYRCPPDRKNGFSVVFAGDKNLQETIWGEFLAFLEKVEKMSNTSKSEEIFYLQFDLFPWATDKIL